MQTSILPESGTWALVSPAGRMVISKLLPILCAAKNGNPNWCVGAKAFWRENKHLTGLLLVEKEIPFWNGEA